MIVIFSPKKLGYEDKRYMIAEMVKRIFSICLQKGQNYLKAFGKIITQRIE